MHHFFKRKKAMLLLLNLGTNQSDNIKLIAKVGLFM